MKNLKFEVAYYEKKKDFISFEKIKSKYKSNSEMFFSNVNPHLYCPECKKAKLIYVNALNPYLRAKESNTHKIGCSFNYPEITQKILDEIVTTDKDKEAMRLRLENSLNQIFIKKEIDLNNNPFVVERFENNNTERGIVHTRKNRIPRKNLMLPFNDDDYDTLKLFYGRAYLKWEPQKYENRNVLLILSSKKEEICEISMSDKVKKYLILQNYIEENFLSQVAFISKMSNDNKIKTAHIKNSALFLSRENNT